MRWPEKPTHLAYVREMAEKKAIHQIMPYVDLEFVATIPVVDGMSVLDVGCFNGRDLRHIWAYHPSCKLVGVDNLKKAIEYCKEKHADTHIEWAVADALKLPFKDHEFDIVYGNGLLSELQVEDRSMAIAEMMRVGKKVYICDLDKDNEFTYEIY